MSIYTNKLGRAFIVASGYSPGMCSLWIYISQEPEIHPPLLRTPFMYDHRHAFDAVPLSPVPREEYTLVKTQPLVPLATDSHRHWRIGLGLLDWC